MAVFQDVCIDARLTVEPSLRRWWRAIFQALADAHTGDGRHGGLCDDEIAALADAVDPEMLDNAIALLARIKAKQEGVRDA